ncbi:MAG: pentapeptide repeat-containing protein, partial [Saccharopolyspora rectivirgula]
SEQWTVKDSFDFVKIVLAVVGGIGGVVALVVSYRKQRLGEAAEEREDAQLFNETFNQAAEQLGSAEAPVRLAGMYTLERLGQNTPEQQQTIANVLCAYLRMPYTPPVDDPAEEDREENERRKQEREVRLTAQRILANNLRPKKGQEDRHWKDIHLDLTGATLLDFDFSSCQVDTALFNGAQFSGDALFNEALFGGNARFDKARFGGNTWFGEARFNGDAWFGGVRFNGDVSFVRSQVRLDVSEDVLSKRVWPRGYVVEELLSAEEERLVEEEWVSDREGAWGYLTPVESEESDDFVIDSREER